jgi:cell division protease FtsH
MDIMQATEMARKMVLDWGMSERLGFIRYAPDPRKGGGMFDMNSREYSEKTAEVIDQEIKLIVDKAYDDTKNQLKEHRVQLESLAQALLKYETLSAEEAQRIISGEGLDKPTVDDLLDLESAKNPPKTAEGALPPEAAEPPSEE